MEKEKQITFTVPKELHAAVKIKAFQEQTTVKEVGKRLFEEWLKNHKEPEQ